MLKSLTMKKTWNAVITSAIATTLIAFPACANAATTLQNNFTMLDNLGDLVSGGSNRVDFTWDGSSTYSSVAAATAGGANATISSVTPFFGVNWQAYQVKIYAPGGPYVISTADTMGGAGCPYPPATQNICASAGNYTITVPAGYLMAHMKFQWGSSQGIDVINLWRTGGSWTGFNAGYSIWTAGPYCGPAYDRVSVDWDSDGIPGGAMVDGPFVGFSANFSVNTVTTCAVTTSTALTPAASTAAEPSLPGCSIAPISADRTHHTEWWLVGGFLVWLGILKIRLRKNHSRV